MKLLMVAHDLIRGDGQGRINYEIALHALEQGHQVTLLADRVEPDLSQRGATWHAIHPPVKKPALFDVRLFTRTANRILKRITKPGDVIVGNGYTLTVPHQVNLCQFVHGAWIHSPMHTARLSRGPYSWYQYLYSRCNVGWEAKTYRNAERIVVPSMLAFQELLSIGVPEAKIRLIPNAVDIDEFKPGHESRAAIGLPADVPLALFAGDIRTPRKNVDSVLKAMLDVPELHLAVVGKLPGSPYPEMSRQLGIADRVHFLGFRRDMGKIMRAVDLFTFPTRYDTFGLVVLEAMATGLPTITAVTAGASELMSPECGVVLKDPNDVATLAEAMKRYTRDIPARQSAAKAARQLAESCTWNKMAAQYLHLCEESRARPAMVGL